MTVFGVFCCWGDAGLGLLTVTSLTATGTGQRSPTR
jgi:hypothetical protein